MMFVRKSTEQQKRHMTKQKLLLIIDPEKKIIKTVFIFKPKKNTLFK